MVEDSRRRGRKPRVVRGVLLAAILAAVLVMSMAGIALADTWTDITDAAWLSNYGVTSQQATTVADGFPDGTFRPDQAVTRGQFAKMALSGLGVATSSPAVPTFSDVAPGDIFYSYVEGGVAAGVISGYGDGTFRPDSTIARQQANAILGLWLAQAEITQTAGIQGTLGSYSTLEQWYAAEGQAILNGFADGAEVSLVHRPATAYLVMRSVVLGSGSGGATYLGPLNDLTRAQAVAMILRVKGASEEFDRLKIDTIAPSSGATSGGTEVVITGSDLSGVGAVKFGSTYATDVLVNTAGTLITCTAPAHAAGIVSVTAVSSTLTSNALTYTYIASAPTVTGVDPDSGLVGGGTTVIISGTGFTNATAVRFGTTAAAEYTVQSASLITAVTPEHVVGIVDVRVTTAEGTSPVAAADEFTYVEGTPTVTIVEPDEGPTVGGTEIVITGTNFVDVTAVRFGSSYAEDFTVDSSTQITVECPAHAEGTVDIRVTAAGGASAITDSDEFTYVEVDQPTITEVYPEFGSTDGGTEVTITGTDFIGVTAVKFGSKAAGSYTVDSDTQITAVAPFHTAGLVNIRVTAAGGTTDAVDEDEFTYVAVEDNAAITDVTPDFGATEGGTEVVITGTDLVDVTSVKFGSVSATSFTMDSDTQLTVIAPAHTEGTVDIRVTAAGGKSAVTDDDEFTYIDVSRPTVAALDPEVGSIDGGTTVVITGTDFVDVSHVRFGTTSATTFTVDSPTQITAVTPAHAAGSVDVRVTAAGGISNDTGDDDYMYVGAPTISSLAPATGPATGGTSITITGTNFTDVTAVTFGGVDATSFTPVDSTHITAVAPAHAAGSVGVRVTAGGGASANTIHDDYIYVGAPTISSLAPATGPATGGTSITITGTNFTDVTAVTFGGVDATSFTRSDATHITAIAPALPAGTVDVQVTALGGASTNTASDDYTYTP